MYEELRFIMYEEQGFIIYEELGFIFFMYEKLGKRAWVCVGATCCWQWVARDGMLPEAL